MLWLYFLTSCFLFGPSLMKENTKLLFLQTLFRHGDRAAHLLYPNDPNSESDWPEGFGKLTVLGRQQQYAVGKYLRNKYKHFITSSPNEIFVRSSNSDRCLRSAESNVASFFAPKGMWKFEPGLDWQPIPIYFVPGAEDKYLSFPNCPKATNEVMDLYESDEVQSFFRDNKESLDKVSDIVGVNVSAGLNIKPIYDTLYAEKVHNLTLPDGIDPYWDLLSRGCNLALHCLYSSPELLKLRAGPLLELIIDNMNDKMNGSLPDLKVEVLSSHEDNVGAMLLALTQEYMPQPPYSATIIFELHEMKDGQGAVRMLYLNSTRPEIDVGKPHVLTLKGCSEFCPLKKFSSIIQPMIPNDWDRECQVDSDNEC